MWISPDTDYSNFEFDELYHFIGTRKGYENGINRYVMTMISRSPRQIAGFDVDKTKTAEQLQAIADSTEPAQNYSTDGNPTYMDVIFGGRHIRNATDKSDTHNVESINSDLRTYIPGLKRKSKCFYRIDETLKAVLAVFIDAYNKFGEKKLKYRKPVIHKSPFPNKHLHQFRDVPFSITDFL